MPLPLPGELEVESERAGGPNSDEAASAMVSADGATPPSGIVGVGAWMVAAGAAGGTSSLSALVVLCELVVRERGNGDAGNDSWLERLESGALGGALTCIGGWYVGRLR